MWLQQEENGSTISTSSARCTWKRRPETTNQFCVRKLKKSRNRNVWKDHVTSGEFGGKLRWIQPGISIYIKTNRTRGGYEVTFLREREQTELFVRSTGSKTKWYKRRITLLFFKKLNTLHAILHSNVLPGPNSFKFF